MATKANKTKSKRRPTAKSKARRARNKPLLAAAALVRTAKLDPKARKVSNGTSPTFPFNPALTMIAMMGRVMGAYVELPARLSRCRHPLDIWFEQARFVQRVFSESTAPADRPSRA